MSSEVESVETVLRGARRDAVRRFKRELIRDSAKRIFAERGIDAASMREIAQASGYTTGSLYTYFATKEDLYAEVLRDSLDALYRAVVCASSSSAPSSSAALRALWRFYDARPADFDLGFYLYGGARLAGLTRGLDEELNSRLDAVMAHIGDCLVTDGLVRADAAHRQGVMHATWIFGLLLMSKTGRLRSVAEQAEPMLDRYLRDVVVDGAGLPTDDEGDDG